MNIYGKKCFKKNCHYVTFSLIANLLCNKAFELKIPFKKTHTSTNQTLLSTKI